MSTLNEEIIKIMNPSKKISIISGNRFSNYDALMPVSLLCEVLEEMNETQQQRVLKQIQSPELVIFGGVIYLKKSSIDIKDRIARILVSYKENIEKTMGEKQALIEIYSKLKPYQIVHLLQHNIVFVMRKVRLKDNSQKMGVVAIKYIPSYEVHFRKDVWRFPALYLASYVYPDLKFEPPEVIPESGHYTHMFVFSDKGFVGQRICMGSFYSDTTTNQLLQQRSFETALSFWMTQAEQILKYGYDEHKNLHPITEIYEPRFEQFRVR